MISRSKGSPLKLKYLEALLIIKENCFFCDKKQSELSLILDSFNNFKIIKNIESETNNIFLPIVYPTLLIGTGDRNYHIFEGDFSIKDVSKFLKAKI